MPAGSPPGRGMQDACPRPREREMPQVGNLTAATYAILRIWTQPKSPNFKSVVRICEMRYVCNPHVACLVFVFTERRLAMPG